MWGSKPPVPQRLVESWHELRSTQGRICPPRRAGSIHTVLWPPSLQDRLQTQLTTLKLEMDEAKAQGTQMGVENGALAGVLLQWVGELRREGGGKTVARYANSTGAPAEEARYILARLGRRHALKQANSPWG